jgi:hypothetical protein
MTRKDLFPTEESIPTIVAGAAATCLTKNGRTARRACRREDLDLDEGDAVTRAGVSGNKAKRDLSIPCIPSWSSTCA